MTSILLFKATTKKAFHFTCYKEEKEKDNYILAVSYHTSTLKNSKFILHITC